MNFGGVKKNRKSRLFLSEHLINFENGHEMIEAVASYTEKQRERFDKCQFTLQTGFEPVYQLIIKNDRHFKPSSNFFKNNYRAT